MADDETMTTSEIAEYLGGLTKSGARKWLRRRGIELVGRHLDGDNLYPRATIMNAPRSERGRRTDLERPETAGDTDS